MDTQKILDFLQRIIDQLGPMGQQAFQIVAGRIIAESIVGLIAGVLLLLVSLIILKWSWNLYHNKGDDGLFIVGPVAFGAILVALYMIYTNGINLLSIDYTTIQRILSLVP